MSTDPTAPIRLAIQALRVGATAVQYEIRTNSYWHGVPAEDAWELGVKEALGGPAGIYAGMFAPLAGEALADWLEVAVNAYTTETDSPECPNCGNGCGGHSDITYHVECGEDIADCTCLVHPLAVARQLLPEVAK
jgi:hypothetical protein